MTRVRSLIAIVVRGGCRSGHVVVTWTRRVWQGHKALMDHNPAYRRQVNVGIGAFLGVLAMHPDLRLIASALVALYVAAHEQGGSVGLGPEPDRWPREDW